MKGHVRKRGKSWCLVYDEGRDGSGKRIQRWRGGYRTKGEAQEALTKTLNSIAEKTYVSPERLTFQQLVEGRWMPAVEGKLRATTIETYRGVLDRHVLPMIGGVQVTQLDPTQLDRLYRQLIEEKKLSPSTVRFVAAVVSSCLRWAKRKRLVAVNVAELADVPAARRPRMRVWTAEQMRRFLDHTADERIGALWRFLALTGCRRGEALGLTRFALDLEAGTARIERQLVPLAGRLEYVAPKSDSGVRTVRLDASTVAALRRHLADQELERAAWGDAYQNDGLVFCHENGTPLDPRGVSQAFQVRRKAAGLPKLTLHGLRHSAATHLALTVGAHRETVRAALGHSSTRTTETYYTHELDAASRVASDGLAEAYDGPRLQSVSAEAES